MSSSTKSARELTEAEWMRQVCQIAELYGWSWAHFRPAKTARGWRTPVSGPLGAGWPDLVFVHPTMIGPRLIFVELKRDAAKPTDLQRHVLQQLGGVVWRPRDIDQVIATLRS